jgi:hypothetical protein
VVASSTPPTSIVLEERNPVPLTVRVREPEPALTEVGEIDVTVGEGVVVVPPPPLPLPLPLPAFEEPPQPASRVAIPRHTNAVRRREVLIEALSFYVCDDREV